MNARSLRGLAAGLVALTLGVSGCAPSTTPDTNTPPASASPTTPASMPTSTTPSATPTPTLAADQTAALASAEEYEAVMARVRANPPRYGQYKMIDLLKPLAYDDWIQASLNGVQPWRDHGWHEEGTMKVLTRDVAQPSATAAGATEVKVTICKDTRGSAVVDKKGNRVKGQQFPDLLKRTYDMRKAKASDSFMVWEARGEEVQACS